MTLTVGENSYVDETDATEYWADRGNAAWAAATEAQREAALIRAADYLDASYRWKGLRTAFDQPMAWPRAWVTDAEGYDVPSDSVPSAIIAAQIQLAAHALTGDLLPAEERGGMIKRTRQKVDVIETETEYMDGAPSGRVYRMVTRMIDGLTLGAIGGATAQLVRS